MEVKGKKYLFESYRGTPLDRSNIHRYIKQAQNLTGIYAHAHMFRHSFAMHLKHRGVDIKDTQGALRHADAATTLNFYYHEELREGVVKHFEEYFNSDKTLEVD